MSQSEKRALSAAWIVMAAMLVPLLGGAVAVFFVARGSPHEPRVVRVRLILPKNATEGEPHQLVIVIYNRLEETVTLKGIDLANAFFDGFALKQTDPPALAHDDGDPFQVFEYDITIGPGEDFRITFDLLAVNAGDWSGDIDIRMTGTTGTQTHQLHTVILPTTSQTPSGENDDGPPVQIIPVDD